MSPQTKLITDIPSRVKWLRAKGGWRQEDFAKSLGISRSFLALIESGRRDPSLRTLEALYAFCEKKLGSKTVDYGLWGNIPNGKK